MNTNPETKRRVGRPRKSSPVNQVVENPAETKTPESVQNTSTPSISLTKPIEHKLGMSFTPAKDDDEVKLPKMDEPIGGFPTFIIRGKNLPEIYQAFIRKYKKINKDDGSNSEGNYVESFLNTMQVFLANYNAIDYWQALVLRNNIPVPMFKLMFDDFMGQLVENKLIYKIDGCYEYCIYSFYPLNVNR